MRVGAGVYPPMQRLQVIMAWPNQYMPPLCELRWTARVQKWGLPPGGRQELMQCGEDVRIMCDAHNTSTGTCWLLVRQQLGGGTMRTRLPNHTRNTGLLCRG